MINDNDVLIKLIVEVRKCISFFIFCPKSYVFIMLDCLIGHESKQLTRNKFFAVFLYFKLIHKLLQCVYHHKAFCYGRCMACAIGILVFHSPVLCFYRSDRLTTNIRQAVFVSMIIGTFQQYCIGKLVPKPQIYAYWGY